MTIQEFDKKQREYTDKILSKIDEIIRLIREMKKEMKAARLESPQTS